MALYDENEVKVSKETEKTFMDNWKLEEFKTPRTTPFKDGHKMLSASEIAEIEAEWAENDRPRTPDELSEIKDAQIEHEFTPAVIATAEAFAVMASLDAPTLIAQAKAKRKLEL